ncbi:MAG: methyltransferase domain-containing protein [Deltaproteobacteria bacterium]|nr:MAG: methyltransferase domain-containing protein [Deltaproteobacteria bacterium]
MQLAEQVALVERALAAARAGDRGDVLPPGLDPGQRRRDVEPQRPGEARARARRGAHALLERRAELADERGRQLRRAAARRRGDDRHRSGPAGPHHRAAARQIVGAARRRDVERDRRGVERQRREVGAGVQIDRLAQPAEVPRRDRAAADVPLEHGRARRGHDAADVGRQVDVVGGLQHAEVVELEARRLDVDLRGALPLAGALAAGRHGVPADQLPRGRIEVEVVRVGALEVVRRAGLDPPDRLRRAEHRGDAADEGEVVGAIGAAQPGVAAADQRGPGQEARERRVAEVALDRGRGGAEQRRPDLVLDPRGGPAGQRRDRELPARAVDDGVGGRRAGQRAEHRDLGAVGDVAAGGRGAEDPDLPRQRDLVGAGQLAGQGADPAAVEVGAAGVAEQRGVLDEERPLLGQPDLERRQVDDRRIDVDLAEVRVDRRRDGEPGQRPELRIDADVGADRGALRERAGRRLVDRHLARGVGQELEAQAALDARQPGELAEPARPRRTVARHGAPEHVLVAARDVPVEVDAPAALRRRRQPELRQRHRELRGPAVGEQLRRGAPHRVPRRVAGALGVVGVDPVGAHARRGDREAVGDPPGVRRIDRHDEALGLLGVVALGQRIIDVVASGRPHPRRDVERLAVGGDRGGHPARRRRAVRRLLLLEVVDEARGRPRRVIELAVDRDRALRDGDRLGGVRAGVRAVGVCRRGEEHQARVQPAAHAPGECTAPARRAQARAAGNPTSDRPPTRSAPAVGHVAAVHTVAAHRTCIAAPVGAMVPAMHRLALITLIACGTPRGEPSAPPPAVPQPEHHSAMHHRFDHADEWAKVWDTPERDAWQQPERVVAALKLGPRMVIADIGAGTGYFSVRLARAVPDGQVIATDIEPDMVRHITERAAREQLPNLRAVQTPPTDPELAPASIDRILVVDVWHHIDDRDAYARALARALRPGGKLAIVDFKRESSHGPPPEHRLPPDEILGALTRAGLRASLSATELPEQYIVIGAR